MGPPPTPAPPPISAPFALRARGVTILGGSPLELQVAPGECLALSGPSGTGKSLLLRALADLDPHPGEVWLEDREQQQVPPPEWRRLVGYLPAESPWWLPLVGDHLPDDPQRPALLETLGFPPEVVGWEVGRLSSGERQRLGLIRLLLNRPRVLLLDEPTANLDPTATRRVEALLAEERRERHTAMIWVSHLEEQIRRVADRHLRLEGGRLMEATP